MSLGTATAANTLQDFTDNYFAIHGASRFPMLYGSKSPVGLVPSFLLDCSKDPAQWAAWRRKWFNCNTGVVACQSGWIIADIDGFEVGRDKAWATWDALCRSWGLPGALAPQCQSPSGS
jgi:hypothetical protein